MNFKLFNISYSVSLKLNKSIVSFEMFSCLNSDTFEQTEEGLRDKQFRYQYSLILVTYVQVVDYLHAANPFLRVGCLLQRYYYLLV